MVFDERAEDVTFTDLLLAARQKAEAATPGRWEQRGWNVITPRFEEFPEGHIGAERDEDAAFIALGPDTFLAYSDVVEAAREFVGLFLKSELHCPPGSSQAELRAALTRLHRVLEEKELEQNP